MHSGVGPKNLLQSLNIPVIFDNPNVGQYFTDQDLIPNIFFSTNPDDTPIPAVDPNNYLNNIAWFPDPLGDPSVRVSHLVTLNPIPANSSGDFFGLSPTTESRQHLQLIAADPSATDQSLSYTGILSNANKI